jgi:hypothetical protein
VCELLAVEIVGLAGRARPQFVLPDGVCMLQVVAARMDDASWVVREAAIRAFMDVVPTAGRDALVAVLPYLHDPNHSVRAAAADAVLKVRVACAVCIMSEIGLSLIGGQSILQIAAAEAC